MVPVKRYLSLAELSILTGLALSTLRRRVREGKLPCIQPGGRRTRVLFPADVLDCLLRQTGGAEDSLPTTPSPPPDEAASHGPRPKWLRDLGG